MIHTHLNIGLLRRHRFVTRLVIRDEIREYRRCTRRGKRDDRSLVEWLRSHAAGRYPAEAVYSRSYDSIIAGGWYICVDEPLDVRSATSRLQRLNFVFAHRALVLSVVRRVSGCNQREVRHQEVNRRARKKLPFGFFEPELSTFVWVYMRHPQLKVLPLLSHALRIRLPIHIRKKRAGL